MSSSSANESASSETSSSHDSIESFEPSQSRDDSIEDSSGDNDAVPQVWSAPPKKKAKKAPNPSVRLSPIASVKQLLASQPTLILDKTFCKDYAKGFVFVKDWKVYALPAGGKVSEDLIPLKVSNEGVDDTHLKIVNDGGIAAVNTLERHKMRTARLYVVDDIANWSWGEFDEGEELAKSAFPKAWFCSVKKSILDSLEF